MSEVRARHHVEYAAYRWLQGLVRLLPHRGARALGRGLGRLGYGLDVRHRRVTLRNLAAVFPELAEPERRALARRCFAHVGEVLCDVLSAARFDPRRLCAHVTLDGYEHLLEAEAAGKGTLAMSAHLGNWEIAAHLVGLYTGDLRVVGRPADNPLLDRALEAARTRYGNHRIDRRGAARVMLRLLHERGRIGILIDQRVPARREGILVPFLGQPAWTTPILARLSLRTGAPVVPIFGFHRPPDRYVVVFRPPIWPGDTPDDEAGLAALTRRHLAAVEEEIRRTPELWLWQHDRWREPRR